MCDDDKKKQPSVPTKDSDFSEDIRHRGNVVIIEKMERPEPWPDPPPEEPESKK